MSLFYNDTQKARKCQSASSGDDKPVKCSEVANISEMPTGSAMT